jgi:hypothetical protein
MEVTSSRIEGASAFEGGAQGFAERFISTLIPSSGLWSTVPLEGRGLGMGTNVGAVLLSGKADFLLAEDEWSRIILEIGPLLGVAFIVFRICLAFSLGNHAVKHARKGNALPILLFAACGLGVLNGNWGQATTLGFVIFLSGLCLSAMRVPAAQDVKSRNDDYRRTRQTHGGNSSQPKLKFGRAV